MEKMKEISRKIAALKRKIAGLGDMRPGSLTRQVRSWGKSYWQLSYTHRGKGGTGYVSNERYREVRRQTENYRKFREMCLELVDLSLELAKLTDKEAASL
jgi:hypothetical protein